MDNHLTTILLVIANVIALLQLTAAFKWPRIARISFFLLFAWAAVTNWRTARQHPEYYLYYAQLAWSGWYVQFIKSWFALHIEAAVIFIATCQALIAVSMLLKGWIFIAGCCGAIIFLIAILPLGTGAGFPSSAIMAAGIYLLMRNTHFQSLFDNLRQDKYKKRLISVASDKSQSR